MQNKPSDHIYIVIDGQFEVQQRSKYTQELTHKHNEHVRNTFRHWKNQKYSSTDRNTLESVKAGSHKLTKSEFGESSVFTIG